MPRRATKKAAVDLLEPIDRIEELDAVDEAPEEPAMTTMPPVSELAVRDLAQVFKLLSDETRLRILLYLAQNGELHVTDLCNRLEQSQPAVSHHLALLRVSGLIESRREGKHNFYSVRTDTFGDMLVSLFSSTGRMPKRIQFHNFTLHHGQNGK